MNHKLPKEAFAEMTALTIQNAARWMEYEDGMEDFALLEKIDGNAPEQSTIFLCGYIPQIEMELAIVAYAEENRGIYYSMGSNQPDAEVIMQEFTLQDYQNCFELNMLMYTATTQIMMRNNEQAYHNLAKELAESKSSCSSCSGCGQN